MKPHCDFRSPLIKTLDWSVDMLGHEQAFIISVYFNNFIKVNNSKSI